MCDSAVLEEDWWVGGLKVGAGSYLIYELDCGARRRVECMNQWSVVE
jgi:hypothetical protein